MDVISYALSKKYTDEKIIEQKLKVATVEKELNDYKNTLAQVNVNQEPRQSVSGYGVLSLPKNAANSSAGVKLEGLTATNLVNGKGDNLEGWNNLAGVSLGTDDKLGFIKLTTLTGLSFCYNVSIYQGHKYYIQTQYIADGIEDNVVNILFRTPDNVSVGVLPLYNSTTNLTLTSKILTPTIDCDRLAFNRSMSGSGQYWFKELMLIDLTQTFGAGNEPTAEECDKIFANYFDDTKSTIGAMRITSENEDKTEKSTAYVIAKDKDNKIVNLKRINDEIYDELDLDSRELIKRTGDLVLDGTENWQNRGLLDNGLRRFPYDSGIWYKSTGANKVEISCDTLPVQPSVEAYSIARDRGICIYRQNSNLIYLTLNDGETPQTILSENPATLTYQLAEPEIIPIQASGNIVSNPSGTIYIEQATFTTGIYNDNMKVMYNDLPIKSINKIIKIDYETGVEHELDTSKAVISENKLSFAHPDLINGDIVFFDYEYDLESTHGETTVEFYDSRYTIKDSITGKFYQWNVTVADGVPSIDLKEV